MKLDSRYRQELRINLLTEEIRIPGYCQKNTVEFFHSRVKPLSKRRLVYSFARLYIENVPLHRITRGQIRTDITLIVYALNAIV